MFIVSKIEIDETEAALLFGDVNNILGYVSLIVNADIDEMAKSAGIEKDAYNFVSVAREDNPRAEIEFDRNIIMQNVRDLSSDNFVKVSKVIDK